MRVVTFSVNASRRRGAGWLGRRSTAGGWLVAVALS
jgi:hypothetical protein